MSNRKNSRSTMINIRVPNFIFDDLKKIQGFLHYSSMSNFIVSVMSAEILKYLKVFYENE